jgi:hypothetical protein
MNNINEADPGVTLKLLREMAANYRERIPEVYLRPFNTAMNRRFSVARAAQFLQEGGHQ